MKSLLHIFTKPKEKIGHHEYLAGLVILFLCANALQVSGLLQLLSNKLTNLRDDVLYDNDTAYFEEASLNMVDWVIPLYVPVVTLLFIGGIILAFKHLRTKGWGKVSSIAGAAAIVLFFRAYSLVLEGVQYQKYYDSSMYSWKEITPGIVFAALLALMFLVGLVFLVISMLRPDGSEKYHLQGQHTAYVNGLKPIDYLFKLFRLLVVITVVQGLGLTMTALTVTSDEMVAMLISTVTSLATFGLALAVLRLHARRLYNYGWSRSRANWTVALIPISLLVLMSLMLFIPSPWTYITFGYLFHIVLAIGVHFPIIIALLPENRIPETSDGGE